MSCNLTNGLAIDPLVPFQRAPGANANARRYVEHHNKSRRLFNVTIRQLSLLSSLSWQHGMHKQQKMKANWEATPSIGRAHRHLASSFFITPRDFHDHSLV